VLLALSAPVHAGGAWTPEQTEMQAAYLVGHALDWMQTRQMVTRRACLPRCYANAVYYEDNPVLGRTPSARDVDRYFLAAAAAQALVVHLLPERWRTHALQVSLAVQFGTVDRNTKIGLSLDF
jgi:hypothetical protein